MKVNVKINDKIITVNCGSGSAKISYIIDSALYGYDQANCLFLDDFKSITNEAGKLLNKNDTINDVLIDGQTLLINLKSDY